MIALLWSHGEVDTSKYVDATDGFIQDCVEVVRPRGPHFVCVAHAAAINQTTTPGQLSARNADVAISVSTSLCLSLQSYH